VQQVKQLAACPTPEELERFGTAWQPWRAVAARLLWHHYLSKKL
jgi:DNA-3-methyladenine glycosylase II